MSGILKHHTVKVYADITYETYDGIDSVPKNTIENTRKAVENGIKRIIIAFLGKSNALAILFHSIIKPPDFNGKRRSLSENAFYADFPLYYIYNTLDEG